MSTKFEKARSTYPEDEIGLIDFIRRKGASRQNDLIRHALPRLDAGPETFQKTYIPWLLERLVAEGKLGVVDNGHHGRYKQFMYGLPGEPLVYEWHRGRSHAGGR